MNDNVIYKLKVKASQVKHFPFDVIYIVREDLKSLLPQMFPYSLCLPFNDDLVERLRKLRIQNLEHVTHRDRTQNDVARTWAEGQPVEQYMDLTLVRKSFLVVPVLPRTHQRTRNRKRKDRNPAYLIANQHRAGDHEDRHGKTKHVPYNEQLAEFSAFFNDFAVMFTPRGPLRPICRACPRHLEHVQGKCTLGEMKCYHELIIKPERRRNGEQLQAD
jgi:hypothetical protein